MQGYDFKPPDDPPQAPPEPAPVVAAPPEPVPAEPPPVPSQPRFDWLTEVLIPAAVFGLLASFFYYLLDVRGTVGNVGLSGLRWVCFWFLLGTILTTRMRTRYGAHVIALPYMLGLGITVCLFVFHVTVYSGAFIGPANTGAMFFALLFNYAVVGVIWWIAGVVTRACTAEENFALMDEQGILTGLSRKSKASAKRTNGSRPRHPGWVLMWTSLVALVCFALGETIIGASSRAHQRHAMMCMVSYSFFALVLLALTSLSALRMSARQRKIRVHSSITPVWTLASAAIVAAILAIAAFLPTVEAADRVRRTIANLPNWIREAPTTPWNDGPEYGIRTPQADPGGHDEAGQDEGARQGAEGAESGEFADSGDDESQSPGGGEGGSESATPESGGAGDDGEGETDQSASDADGGAGGTGSSGEGGGGQGEGDLDDGDAGDTDSSDSPSDGGGASDEGQGEDDAQASASGEGEGAESDTSQDAASSGSTGGAKMPPWWLWLLILLALILLALLIAYLVWRALKNRKNWPSFRGWLGSLAGMARGAMLEAWAGFVAALTRAWAWLCGLFGRRPVSRKLGDDGLPEDPFLDIFNDRELSESLTPAQVVRHVYAAFQAFGGLIGHPRPDDQTPYEFSRNLPPYIGGMPRDDADDITSLYVKAAYSPESVGEGDVDGARDIWERMQAPIDSALAGKQTQSKTPAESPA